MADNNVSNYLRWITPRLGDPTYSLLKAHLLFEELLNAYLQKVLPHADALRGARLTFAQTLALSRACGANVMPDHWAWTAISELNKLRNLLSHEARPKGLAERMDSYVSFVVQHTQLPLPQPEVTSAADAEATRGQHLYSALDMVTLDLYYTTAMLLGFRMPELEDLGGGFDADFR